jgi:hypothetical protein
MIDQPLYAPARNLSWLIGVIAAVIIIYVVSKIVNDYRKKKK